jgi:hypothetical protein
MRVFCRLGAGLGLFVLLGLACKDSGGPVAPSILVRVAGDTQVTPTGDQARIPLTVRVTGSDGHPFPGATVTWTVTAGSGTLGSPTALSDAQGLASTTLTLGATPGAIGVQAVVGNVTPVAFHECAGGHPVLALNDTLSGALATTDCRFGGYYTGFFTDLYELTVPPGSQGVAMTMTSSAFDTYLELYLRSGAFLGWDDDIDSLNKNSQVTAILAAGDYLLAPSSFFADSVGAYTIAAVTQPAELAGCGLVWATRGVTISDSVTAGDCVDTTGGPYYADVVALRLVAGTVLKVSHHSAAFDAALFLRSEFGVTVASNNDSAATTTNAYISLIVPSTGSYLLFVGTNAASATGAYDLDISTATTLSGSARREDGRQLLPLGNMRFPKGRVGRTWSRTGT